MEEIYNKIKELYIETSNQLEERIKEKNGFLWGSDVIGQRMYGAKDVLETVLECFNKEQKVLECIQWNGHNLKNVLDFTGKFHKFDEWFKSFDDFENYVKSHDNIFKLWVTDNLCYRVPVGAWLVKCPDGNIVPSKGIQDYTIGL